MQLLLIIQSVKKRSKAIKEIADKLETNVGNSIQKIGKSDVVLLPAEAKL